MSLTSSPVIPATPSIQVIERLNTLLDVLARQSEPV